MYSLYNLLLLALLPIIASHVFLRWLTRGEDWRSRLGYLSGFNREGALWFHGSSVGEIGGLKPLVSRIRKIFPTDPLVVSAMTKTGRDRAVQELKEADLFILSPLDFPPFVKRTLATLKPRILVIAETELWPNLLREARRAGTKVAMVNGRLSDRSFAVYKFFRRFFHPVIQSFDLLCVQTEKDRQRLLELGARLDRIHVSGSLKFDASPQMPAITRKELGIPDGVPIFVAGSTRPGEEEIVFQAFKEVKQSFPSLRLIVAPRHLRRTGDIEKLASRLGLSLSRRSEGTSMVQEVLLLDSLGELPRVYGIGTVAFVGGTLLPYGGHNLLEPAFHTLPVIFGPHTDSMQEVAARLLEVGGGVAVRDRRDLALVALNLLTNDAGRRRSGEAALQVAQERVGGTERTLTLMRSHGLI